MWKGCRSRSVVDRVGRGQSNEARRTRSRNPFWYSQSNLKVYHSSWPCSDTLKWRDRKGGENYDLVPLECLSHIRTMFSLGAVQCACLIGHMGSFCQPSWFCHRDSMGRAPIQSHSWRSGQLLFFLLQWWNSIKLLIIMEDWNWLTPHSLLLWEYFLTETQIEILL